ncbi:MAG: hypothetical protein GEU91_19365 [Rhizobiales bacterium]|nr:hypothetical protein [Hyphomicrobiales bacterium]
MPAKLLFTIVLAGVFAVSPATAQTDRGMAVLSAVVAADGTTARGAGVLSSAGEGAGIYLVTFNRDIRDCTYMASVGGTGFESYLDSRVSVAWGVTTPEEIFVNTYAGGVFAALPFHLIVFCAR